jgi:transcriptional regulator with XRE-family HTH domain
MATTPRSPLFRDWLADAIDRSGLSKREIARRMAAKHPQGVTFETIETGRRTINKILAGKSTPTQPTRDAIADALERDDHPSESADDEEEDEPVPDLLMRAAYHLDKAGAYEMADRLRLRARRAKVLGADPEQSPKGVLS